VTDGSGRQWVERNSPSRDEHNDLKTRVGAVESKLDRMTWLIIATLAASLADLLIKVKP
jgi:hypothetical protein